MVRWIVWVTMIASIAAFVTLILWSGAGEILHGIRMIGWGLVVLVGFRLVALTLAGLAWGTLFGRRIERPASVYIGLRLIREAINCLLPAAQVGGDLIGARLLARTGVPAGLAGAGILVDILLQASTQGVFALIGLAALWTVFGDGPVVREAGVGLILAVPALGGFFLAQRLGLFLLVDRGLGTIERLFPAFSAGGRIDLHPSLRLLYSDHAALARASLIHLAGWSVGTAEIWVALGQMGMGPSFAECLVLESLGQAVRSAGFAVPGALGIQEGGFILLGAIFGLTPPTAVALSIAKRLPDFAIGIPGLIAWQCLEAARLKTQPKHR